jgi:hypothetical protein
MQPLRKHAINAASAAILPSIGCQTSTRISERPHAIQVFHEAVRVMAPSMLDTDNDDADIMPHVELAEGRATYALESCTRGLRYTWSEDSDG